MEKLSIAFPRVGPPCSAIPTRALHYPLVSALCIPAWDDIHLVQIAIAKLDIDKDELLEVSQENEVVSVVSIMSVLTLPHSSVRRGHRQLVNTVSIPLSLLISRQLMGAHICPLASAVGCQQTRCVLSVLLSTTACCSPHLSSDESRK